MSQVSKSNNRNSNNQQGVFVDVNLTPTTPIAQAVIVDNINVEFNENMKLCLKKALIINIVCLFDLISGLIYSFYYPIFLLPLIGAITGYFGTKKFSKPLIIVYLIYLTINILFRTINFGFILNSSTLQLGLIIFSIFIFLFDFFILTYTCSMFSIMNKLLDSELSFLRTNLSVQKKFICN